ncbi:hypothetical protein [uncultured Agitococcus sp.]|uniref:GREB1-related protein n=1 Tax=uncultured Agitococcus sp. TaxID=1506599 RepID=UPI00262550C3|nr:hypothetical protein [uncultured Agitococcus sp.]
MNKLLDYAVIIPTHGRYDRVFTIDSLRKSGYTGDIYLLCDDEDKQLEQYKEKYGDKVIVFSKDEYIGKFDKMDNFGNKACVVYARNAMWDAAKKLGLKFFIVADDDYTALEYRITADGGYYAKKIKNADGVFAAYVNFLKTSGVDTVCFAQGGDYIGGKDNSKVKNGFKVSRKMMNLYFFSADKPIEFKGTINEDLTSSVTEGQRGQIILTSLMNSVVQKETQTNAGGLTEIYLELGTYTKSFYSVMAAPSCVKIASMGDTHLRIHHEVHWKNAVPKIIRED